MGQYRRKEKAKSLEKEIYISTIAPNLTGLLIASIYEFYFSGMTQYGSGVKNMILTELIFISFILFGVLIIERFTNRLITQNISNKLEQTGTMNEQDRTFMAQELMALPLKICLHNIFVFIFMIICCFAVLCIFLHMPLYLQIYTFIPTFYASFNVGVMTYCYSEGICSKKNFDLIKTGINSADVHRRKVYGMKMYTRVFYHVVFPAIFINLIQCVALVKQHFHPVEEKMFCMHFLMLLIFNVLQAIMTASLFYRHISHDVKKVNEILEKINTGAENRSTFIPTDLGTEISYTIYIINEIISYLKNITDDVTKTSDSLFNSTQDLTISAKETATNAAIQAKSVKECVNSMASMKEMLAEILRSIKEVSTAAEETLDNVLEGSDILKQSINKIDEITSANLETITGIKNLSGNIDKVWSIISTIDSIAEKTRIIAFNAEIEATTAGDSGENFHIVATEIRRLASTITDSTKEIRSRIIGIQHSSDNLIISSEGGTEKIREGSTLFAGLEENFEKLTTSSKITAESATDIQETTYSQDATFLQISETLKQLSQGFDDFSQSAKTISDASENLENTAFILSTIQGNRGDK